MLSSILSYFTTGFMQKSVPCIKVIDFAKNWLTKKKRTRALRIMQQNTVSSALSAYSN